MISTEPLFTLAKLAQSFKAIGDETRLRMIGLLTTGELCVCDFMAVLELPQSTASRHLAYLKNSGWVTGRRSGKWMHYKLHPHIAQDNTYALIAQKIATCKELEQDLHALAVYREKKVQTALCTSS